MPLFLSLTSPLNWESPQQFSSRQGCGQILMGMQLLNPSWKGMAHRKVPCRTRGGSNALPKGAGNQPTEAGWVDHNRTGNQGREELRASQPWEYPQQGVCALTLPPGMHSKVQWVAEVHVQVPIQPEFRKTKTSGNQEFFVKEAPPFPRKPPYCYPGCIIAPGKSIKNRATAYQNPNKYKRSRAKGNSLGPEMTKQL